MSSWRISSHNTIVAVAGRIARILEAAPFCVFDIASFMKTLVSMMTIGRGFFTTAQVAILQRDGGLASGGSTSRSCEESATGWPPSGQA